MVGKENINKKKVNFDSVTNFYNRNVDTLHKKAKGI